MVLRRHGGGRRALARRHRAAETRECGHAPDHRLDARPAGAQGRAGGGQYRPHAHRRNRPRHLQPEGDRRLPVAAPAAVFRRWRLHARCGYALVSGRGGIGACARGDGDGVARGRAGAAGRYGVHRAPRNRGIRGIRAPRAGAWLPGQALHPPEPGGAGQRRLLADGRGDGPRAAHRRGVRRGRGGRLRLHPGGRLFRRLPHRRESPPDAGVGGPNRRAGLRAVNPLRKAVPPKAEGACSGRRLCRPGRRGRGAGRLWCGRRRPGFRLPGGRRRR